MNDIPKAYTISKIKVENYRTKTFEFKEELKAEPGQFVMAWIPNADEKPMSVSSETPFSITVASVGEFSKKLCSMKEGEKIGIKGPYGTSFSIRGKKIILIGGGYGIAPLLFLAKRAIAKGIQTSAIIGGRKKTDIIMKNEFEKAGCKVYVSTDDGSDGKKGTAADLLSEMLEKEKFDAVYSCGPEKMMLKIAEIAKRRKIACELSIERIMKCGIGICGHCSCGGLLVCKHGTVFSAEQLEGNEDFGISKIAMNGKKVKE